MRIATYWVKPGATDPEDLAGEHLARRGGTDHEFHDPAALLRGDARRHPHAVDDHGHEQQDDEDDAEEGAARDGLRRDGHTAFGGDVRRPSMPERPAAGTRPSCRVLRQRRRPVDDAEAQRREPDESGCGPRRRAVRGVDHVDLPGLGRRETVMTPPTSPRARSAAADSASVARSTMNGRLQVAASTPSGMMLSRLSATPMARSARSSSSVTTAMRVTVWLSR